MARENNHKQWENKQVDIEQFVQPLFFVKSKLYQQYHQEDKYEDGSHSNWYLPGLQCKLLQVSKEIIAIKKQDCSANEQDDECLTNFSARE